GIDVSIIQTVPGENDESHFPGRLGSRVDLLQLCAPASTNPTLSEFAGVDLDLRRANFLTLPDLLEIGIDEDRDVDCRLDQLPDDLLEIPGVQNDIESAFGRQLIAAFGDERHLMWLDRLGNAHHFGRARHFDVEMC